MLTNGLEIDSPASQVSKLGMAAYRAPSLFQPHRAREALADAHAGRIPPLIGYFAGLSSTAITRVVAPFGYDVVAVDWEHSTLNVETMTQMVHDIQFMSEGRSMAFVRVPGVDHALIGYAMDAGASIIVPQVETVEQARHVIAAAKYGRKANGSRSAPPERFFPGITDGRIDPSLSFHQNLNKQAAIVIQIESLEAIHNLDAILTELGDQIDSVWLGSMDARVSMDLLAGGVEGDDPQWLEAKALYESTLRKHNKPASGLALGSPESMKSMARGRSFVVCSGDMFGLMQSGLRDVSFARENFARMDYSQVYKVL